MAKVDRTFYKIHKVCFPMGIAVILAFSIDKSQASLKWRDEVVEVTTHSFNEAITAKFEFVNEGLDTEFGEIKTSCGCMITKSNKGTIKGGDFGVLEVTLNTGGRHGQYSKDIAVWEKNRKDPKILTLKVNILAVCRLEPGFIYWPPLKRDEFARVKIIHDVDFDVRVIAAQSLNDNFVANLEKNESGEITHLKVKAIGDAPGKSLIQLKIEALGREAYIPLHVESISQRSLGGDSEIDALITLSPKGGASKP